jgi:hypothetical protein
VLPAQQPFGHEVASQTQADAPLEHSCPEAHAAQAAPAAPQELFDSEPYGTHVVPLQHPFGHDVASQTHWPVLVLHSWPVEQAAHAVPPAPHDAFDSLDSSSHVEPLQQPEHEDPPQLHTPLVHACPEPHVLHTAPAVPHTENDCDE